MYKEYQKGLEELQKTFIHETRTLIEFEKEEFDNFSIKAKKYTQAIQDFKEALKVSEQYKNQECG